MVLSSTKSEGNGSEGNGKSAISVCHQRVWPGVLCQGSFWAAAGLGLALPGLAFAQAAPSASRVAPESLAPVQSAADGSITLPERSIAGAPAGADDLTITVGGITVTGADGVAPAGVAKVTSEALAELSGQTVKVSAIYRAAAKIEAAYARAGMVLTRVTVPPQHLSNGGAVRLQLVDGFIESIDVNNVPKPVREAVRQRAAGLVGIRGLSLAQIERRVLLAGQVPGVSLQSTLVRGQATGATQLVLSAQYQPVSGSLSFDNNLGSTYQYHSFTAQIAGNSLLGLGEQIYVQATTGPDLDHLFSAETRRRILGAGVVMPIGASGLTFNPEFIHVDTNPRSAAGTVQVTGRFERVALRLAYPLILTRRESLGISGSFELIDEKSDVKSFALALNHDRLRVVGLGLNYAKSVGSALVVSAGGDLNFGLSGLGARSLADAAASGITLSRQGAKPDFSKISGHLRLDDRLGQGLTLASITRAQASLSGALPASAEFALDGTEGLSSFAQGTVNADSGITERLELARPVNFGHNGASVATPYVFAAVGYGHLSNPTALEPASINSWAVGAGLRLRLAQAASRLGAYATVEVSRGHVTTLASDPTRVSASVSFRF